MEAYQSDFEQDLLCESVERSEPEWEITKSDTSTPPSLGI